jgi:hypothetical protein
VVPKKNGAEEERCLALLSKIGGERGRGKSCASRKELQRAVPKERCLVLFLASRE